MKQFPQHLETSDSNNHKLVRLNLDIAQCKLLFSLLDREYAKVEAGALIDKDNVLAELMDYLWQFIQPTDLERAANESNFNAWLDNQDIDSVNAVLQTCASQGVVHVE